MRQKNNTQTKENEEIPEKGLNKIQANNLSDIEVKVRSKGY